MLTSSALVLVGLLLLVAGGEILLRGAVSLATLLRLTPAVIGLTVVAAGTSVPELAVSVIAATQGKTDITVANVIGSNIFNATFIVGAAALVRPLVIRGNTISLEYPVLALVTLLSLAVMHDGGINRLDAILFLCIYAGFTAYLVSLVRGRMNETEIGEYRAEVGEIEGKADGGHGAWTSVLLVAGGVVLLAGGAQATVTGAVGLARFLGWSERIIGLTIIAAGTGLPEVVTSLVSCYRGRDDIAIGNVLGSNLFNILGILGLSSLARPLAVPQAIIDGDNWWMLGVTLLLFPLMITGRKIGRREGILLLAVYVTYIALLL